MTKSALLPALLLLLPSLAAAHPPQHKWVTKEDVKENAEKKKQFGKYTTWAQADEAIKDAEKDLSGDERGCGEATRAYDAKAFSGGRSTAAEKDSLRNKKQAACNKAAGTETKLLNVLNDVDKFLDADLEDAEAQRDSGRIASNKSHQQAVSKIRGKHAAGHGLNPHKR